MGEVLTMVRRLWALAKKPPLIGDEEKDKEIQKNYHTWFHKMGGPMAHVMLKHPDALRRLDAVLKSQNENSDCIFVKRLVTGDKGRTHLPFIYTKLFRLPQIHTQWDITQVRDCRKNIRHGLVCINPYHYEKRGGPPAIPAIVVKKGQFAGACQMELSNMSLSMSDYNTCRNLVETSDIVRDGCPNVYPTMEDLEQMNERLITLRRNKNETFTARQKSIAGNFLLDCDNQTIQITDGPEEAEEEDATQYETEAVEYTEGHVWGQVHYYEGGTRLGTPFYMSTQEVVVDGFMSPSGNSVSIASRFCVGAIPNSQRTPDIVEARNHIGHGVRIHYVQGEVFVDNVTGSPLFIQSPWMNTMNNWHIATVMKVPAYCVVKIFNIREFASVLAAAVCRSYETAYALTRMCAIRISFGKGWGCDFSRNTITTVPCWIEVQMSGPLLWIDRTLCLMGSPNVKCTSFT